MGREGKEKQQQKDGELKGISAEHESRDPQGLWDSQLGLVGLPSPW